MKRFDRVEIMTRAWEIKRKLKNTLAAALKMSWILAKKALELKEYHCELDGRVEFKLWANYGQVRAYYTCSWRSKYQNNKGHYVSL